MTNEQTSKPKDPRPWFKKKRIIIPGALLGLAIIGSQLDENKAATPVDTKTSDTTVSISTQDKKEVGLDLKTKLQNTIKSLGDDFDVSKSSLNDAQDFTIAAAIFKAYAMTINEGKASTDKEVLKLAQELEKKVITSQQKNFPKLRKAYYQMVKDKLWEHDVDVSVSGSGSTVLTFTGGYFAANKNIKETQETLSEMLTLLHFKQTNYKWYKYDDEYTYYKIDSPKDSEVVE